MGRLQGLCILSLCIVRWFYAPAPCQPPSQLLLLVVCVFILNATLEVPLWGEKIKMKCVSEL